MTLRAVSSGAASGGQNASYIAGTWLPVVTASVTNGTPVYSIQVGSYEIIGRQVMARFTIALTGWGGTPSGSVQISLPVPSINISNEFGGGVMDN
jgi:hypothetical protein